MAAAGTGPASRRRTKIQGRADIGAKRLDSGKCVAKRARCVHGRSVMSFETYFRFTSYGFISTAFVALVTTGQLDTVSIILYMGAIGAVVYRDWRGISWLSLTERRWRLLAIAYVPFFLLDATLISRQRIIALVHLTLFTSAAKLFQEKTDRDWVFLYLIAFFQMLLAAALTFDATFVGSLIVFTFFFVSALSAFEIRRTKRSVGLIEEEVVTKGEKILSQRTIPAGRVRQFVGASVIQLVMVGVLTIPLFFLIPRTGSGVVRGFGGGEAMTGFSTSMSLGDVARIKESSQLVMRVKLDQAPRRWLRWKGVALDTFRGNGWEATYKGGISSNKDLAVAGNTAAAEQFDRDHIVDANPALRPLRQQISLE